jgi:predicted lipoprotein with Yx(FWY)xxD motif
MRSNTATWVRVALGLLVLGSLAGCAGTGAEPAAGPDDEAPTSEVGGSPSDDADRGVDRLAVAGTELGDVVVDDEGNVLYQFDKDTQDADSSACSGQCAAMWPAVPAGEELPELDGISAEVGSITGTDGEPQLTLDGWPLYYFAGDAVAGETNGQAVNDVWWVLDPSGSPIRD